ncbi:TetR family transcriptional regulator [Nocardia terpenica]|uniref:TetR family transcriptional regulator n=1 Tax=Nocardia terpenica TaxID=455432 RepID=A0A6G9Z929_9NOCA|nr:TetR family transcriptional regulator [Nocardia terpenica]QIS21992.1 TetR family transcriptional regulator [Nocardia terpenica]
MHDGTGATSEQRARGRRGGLREQKKLATREALSAAALRLALEHGPENVRVDDIAEAAGVSPRTYNNYFSSREQAIVAAVMRQREHRIAAALAERPATEPLADAVVEAIVSQYATADDTDRDALLLITTSPTLRGEFVGTIAAIEQPLADAIAERSGTTDLTARVLATAVAAAVRLAVEQWLRPAPSGSLVVTPSPLPDLLRSALAPLRPALDL